MNSFEHTLQEEIICLNNLIFLLDEAARTERFLSKPKHPGTPSMYDAILTTYEGVVDAVRYNELVNWIVSEEMPPIGVTPLNQSEITIVQNWANCE